MKNLFRKGCQSWIKGKHHSEETKNKISDKNKLNYSNPIKRKQISDRQKGKNNPNFGKIPWNKGRKWPEISGANHPQWKGGITSENDKIRHSLEYFVWRDEVYRRDNWTCRLCKKHCNNKEIIAHHLKQFADFPELRFSIDNGITVCRSCHLKIHKACRGKRK